jgi:hypothetical protein
MAFAFLRDIHAKPKLLAAGLAYLYAFAVHRIVALGHVIDGAG